MLFHVSEQAGIELFEAQVVGGGLDPENTALIVYLGLASKVGIQTWRRSVP